MVSIEIRDKFKQLYKEKFDVTLTDEESVRMATDLVNLVSVLVKPEPKLPLETKAVIEKRDHDVISLQSYQ